MISRWCFFIFSFPVIFKEYYSCFSLYGIVPLFLDFHPGPPQPFPSMLTLLSGCRYQRLFQLMITTFIFRFFLYFIIFYNNLGINNNILPRSICLSISLWKFDIRILIKGKYSEKIDGLITERGINLGSVMFLDIQLKTFIVALVT